MGLFKAFQKYLARTASDEIYNNDKKIAKKESYSETGKDLTKAKKKGKRINAKAVYQKKYSAKIEKAQQRKDRRDKFIDDL